MEIAYMEMCDKHALMNILPLKKRSSPWITHDIIKLVYQRGNGYMHTKAIQKNYSILWKNYRDLRNKVTCAIKERKMPISLYERPFEELIRRDCGQR